MAPARSMTDKHQVVATYTAAADHFDTLPFWHEFGRRTIDRLGLRPGAIVLDLCCGTGAIGAAIAAAVGDVELHAADVDPAAVRCARRNVPGSVYAGDLYEALPPALRGRVDVLVANAPYVPTDAIATMPPEARDHEARIALDGGGDGLEVHRRVAAGACDWLAPRGHLLIETGVAQAPVACDLFRRHGLRARVARSEDHDATVVIGTT